MEPARVIYYHDPDYGWSFDSPDLPGLVGGDERYEEAHRLAEEGVRFHLESDAEERGEDPASVVVPPIAHYVPEHSRAAAA